MNTLSKVSTKEVNKEMRGKKIISIEGMQEGSEEVRITFEDNSFLIFYHEFDCCESVEVCQVDSDPSKFVGSKFTELKIKQSYENEEDTTPRESCTWTFYTLVTTKGYLDFRWLGESNGYYSEEVSIDMSF